VLRRLAPPKDLGGRIRWLFLIFILFNLVTAAPRLLSGTADGALKAAALAGMVGLGYWWVRGYRNRYLPAWAIPVEGLAFFAVGLGQQDWVATMGLLFTATSYRGLFGGWRQVAMLVGVLGGAATGVVVLVAPDALPAFLQQASGVPALAIFTAAVATSTRQQEAAHAREQLFAHVGTLLAGGPEREVICDTGADAAYRMLADLPGGWSAVTLTGEDGETTASLAGAAPAELLVGDVTRQGAISFALETDKQRYGTLWVGGEKAVPKDVRGSVEALVTQLTLGLVNAEYAADMRHRAFHDGLTGLANRALLRDHLSQAISRARRGAPLAVLLIDLDGFKQVNDVHGHAAGDYLLVTIAQRLHAGVRGGDTAARIGGDEFAVVLDGMDAEQDATSVAERLLASITAPVRMGEVELHPGASVGVTTWQGQSDVDTLLQEADAAMYAAKTSGKGQVVQLTPEARASA
jgi:diguanylate cyclase (GGDEF)-like protein